MKAVSLIPVSADHISFSDTDSEADNKKKKGKKRTAYVWLITSKFLNLTSQIFLDTCFLQRESKKTHLCRSPPEHTSSSSWLYRSSLCIVLTAAITRGNMTINREKKQGHGPPPHLSTPPSPSSRPPADFNSFLSSVCIFLCLNFSICVIQSLSYRLQYGFVHDCCTPRGVDSLKINCNGWIMILKVVKA